MTNSARRPPRPRPRPAKRPTNPKGAQGLSLDTLQYLRGLVAGIRIDPSAPMAVEALGEALALIGELDGAIAQLVPSPSASPE